MTGNLSFDGDKTRPFRRKNRATEHLQDDEDDPLPAEGEEGPQVRMRDVFGGWFHHGRPEHAGVSVDVEHYIHDKSFRHRLILLSLRNSKIGIRMQCLRFSLALIGCLLYIVEASYLDFCQECGHNINITNFTEDPILRDIEILLLLNGKPWLLWALQVVIGVCMMINALLILYTISSWSMKSLLRLLDLSISVGLIVGGLFLITLLYPVLLKDLFIPSFLLIWPARQAFSTALLLYMQRKHTRAFNTFRYKAVSLILFLMAFIFTWVCLLHHIERIDHEQKISFFDTGWFVLVTLSTVGYGDIAPKHWTGKLLVAFFIITALIYLIPQLEELFEAFHMQQKLHNTVSYQKSGKHIIVCAKRMKPLVLRDFLTEFYSDPSHYELHCVVLVEEELSSALQVYLSHPVWARRITVIIGSPLRISDLARARVERATACFLHTVRDERDPERADQYTIMSAWAIKSYARDCKLHVQILKPANKLYLDIADHVVCEGELKHALLANHTLCPGTSTLVTLLLHTFKPEERRLSSEDYKLYSRCAPCEIYDSLLGDSKYFHHFVGKNFLYTAVVAFRKYHVTLLGVRGHNDQQIRLNPGLDHIMHADDTVYYIGFTREEYSKVGGASHIHTALWEICAKASMFTLAVSGIDPMDLDEHHEAQYVGENGHHGDKGVAREGVDFQPAGTSPVETARFIFPEKATLSVSDTQTKMATNGGKELLPENRQKEARKGLQLLRYHSHLDIHANPVVKLNIPVQQPASNHGLELCPEPGYVTFTLGEAEEGRSTTPIHPPLQSFTSYPGAADGKPSPLKRPGMYSSDLSLILPGSPSHSTGTGDHHFSDIRSGFHSSFLWQQNSSRQNLSRQNSLDQKHQEEEVVLELNNIEEEEELEELEDGRCPVGAEDVDNSPPPFQEDKPIHNHPRQKYKRGILPVSPYCDCEPLKCHLLPAKRPHPQIRLGQGEEGDVEPSYRGAVIAYCDEASDEVHHFVFPLRAHYLPSRSLRPVILMFGKEPSSEFLDTIAWLPMVYYCVGHVLCINDWLKAGILHADSIALLSSPPSPHTRHTSVSTPTLTPNHSDQSEYMVDAAHIMAVQKLSKLFPSINIITELHYRYSIHFMRFTSCATYDMRSLSAVARRGDHLTYLFVPQFAAGRAFCSSMLDTLLYQANVKPYIIDLVRQLLGCKQVAGSAFLWKVKVTEELLKLRTYERLFQRLVSTQKLVPLGIYRTIPTTACPEIHSSKTYHEEKERAARFLESRLQNLGLKHEPSTAPSTPQCQSFVLANPSPKTELKPNDMILVLKPALFLHSSSLPPPSSHPTPSGKPPSYGVQENDNC